MLTDISGLSCRSIESASRASDGIRHGGIRPIDSSDSWNLISIIRAERSRIEEERWGARFARRKRRTRIRQSPHDEVSHDSRVVPDHQGVGVDHGNLAISSFQSSDVGVAVPFVDDVFDSGAGQARYLHCSVARDGDLCLPGCLYAARERV